MISKTFFSFSHTFIGKVLLYPVDKALEINELKHNIFLSLHF